jgi:hypothetical protein
MQKLFILLFLFIVFLGNCFNLSMPPRWGEAYTTILLFTGFKNISIAYTNNPYTFSLNVPIISVTPVISDTVASCVSIPSLPSGLILDPTTCTISGTPIVNQSDTSYKITAKNGTNRGSTTIQITVDSGAPSALSYAGSPLIYTINVPIPTLSPTITGTATSFSVTPALPTGLTIDPVNGQLSGTPTAMATAATYTVTASNPYGSTTFGLTITVDNLAPSSLNYAGAPFVYTKGVTITAVSPTITGTASSYSVSPALPAGLSINTTTGQLAGTPTAIMATGTYTVTATNPVGSTTFNLVITVNDTAPSALSYSGNPFTFTKNVAITTVNPTITGTPVSYSVSPALPTGLAINTTTGQLSGTPTVISSTTTYTVTATNTGGSTTFALSITVNDTAPSALSYSGSPFTFTKNVAITSVNPTITGTPVSYSVSPALPTGLAINTTTGQLAGTPTAITSTATYTVTATNTGGSTTFALSITVKDTAPSSLSYSGSPFTYTKGTTITAVNPTITGTPVSYSVSPALPTGLAINTTTGQLAGTPTAITSTATYTVTATNTGGSTTFGLSITVNDYYTIGGTISGLSGTIVMQNNSGDDLTKSSNGSFTFATSIVNDSAYSVTILTQPNGQNCTVSSGSGTATANVTAVSVSCVFDTSLTSLEITQPQNWSAVQAYLQQQAALGSSGIASTSTIAGVTGTAKMESGVLAPNGKIYGIPFASTSVWIIDPNANTVDTTTISGLGAGNKWEGGVLGPNGKIYGMPIDSTSVLIIDPSSDTADTTSITGLSGTWKWAGGVLAPNGKIYGIPRDSTSVLIIDPSTNTADTTTITGLSGTGKWIGGVLAPNGKIYGIPHLSTSVLIIDPVTNTANTSTITGLSGTSKWLGGVLAPNGKIYGIPFNSTNVLIIDPVTNTANTTTITGLPGSASWCSGVLAPNGKIYAFPYSSSSLLIIDPVTNTADTSSVSGLGAGFKWGGGVLALNGKIYGMPMDSANVLAIDPKSNGSWSSSLILSGYFAKQ